MGGVNYKPIGELCTIVGGGTPSKSKPEFYSGSIPWATIRDMRNDVLCNTEFSITEEAVGKSATNIIPAGNVIIATRVGLGKVCLVKQATAINQDLRGIIPYNTNELSIKYLFWWFKSIGDYIARSGTGMTVKGVKIPFIKGLKIPLRPLPEQRRIVDILDEAFEGIARAKANAEKNLQNARELFEGYLQSIKAEQAALGDHVQIRTGKLDANAAVEGGKYPFFTCSRSVFAIDKYAFDCEAILLAGNNAVGDFNVKHYKGKFNAYQRTYVITAKNEKSLNYRFLYYQILKSLKQFKAQSVGTGTKFLKIGMIQSLQISMPDIKEQEIVANKLDDLHSEIQKLESLNCNKLTAFEDLKKSLLNQAFTGKL